MTSLDPALNQEELTQSSHVVHEHESEDNRMLGFIIFLLSESVIFLSFFAGYIVYKTTMTDWLPAGVSGLEVREPAINTVVLVSSSFVIYIAELF